ncbi:MAG: CoA-binding protein [Euryarchaeota archaeon]|nr:CoA-binding protein [Euryarchaeota archaeon]
MDAFFYPRSIAVIGASRESGKVGYSVLKNLMDANYRGELVPVNPNAEEVLGLKAYPKVKKVDLAIIVVPANIVPSVLEDSARVGVKASIIISAGFRESGPQGAILETQIRGIAKEHSIRIVGPNCLGIISTGANMNASFASEYPSKGNISLISQSGAICTSFLDWAANESLGFDKLVSVGNKADVAEAELLEYIAHDPSTNVVALYVEGIDNGREFMRVAKEVSRMTPLVVLKAGRTDMGAKAASSHTGALAGSDAAYDAAFKQSGIIRVNSIEELFDAAKAFSRCPIPKSSGMAIITNDGTFLEPAMLSSGERHLFLLFCNSLVAMDRPSILMIDEPEISLNIKWQRRLLNFLLECSGDSPVQYLFSTHSIELLAQHRGQVAKLENIRGK